MSNQKGLSNSDPENALSGKRQRMFTLFMLLIPIAFFALLEVGLRIADYGQRLPLFLPLEDDSRYLFPNQDLAKRYFRNQSALPTIPFQTFHRERDSVDIRVVVQGGSSAAGYPYYYTGGLADYLSQFLEQAAPSERVEVINTALSAVNSFTLLDLADEIISIQPDLVVIYAGHNEYYGALGVASTESSFASPGMVRAYLNLRKFRTVQLVQNVLSSRGRGPAQEGPLMGRMVGESSVPYGSDLFVKGLDQFSSNLNKLLGKYRSEGIPVLVCTVVSNERDFAPFDGKGTTGLRVEAGREGAARDVIAEDSLHADAFFSLASSLVLQGDTLGASDAFKKAKDVDNLRFRAPAEINDIIRKQASSAELVDTEADARNFSSMQTIGGDLITEHLHPTPTGYRLLAPSVFGALRNRELLGRELADVRRDAASAQIATDSLAGEYRLVQIMGAWPFKPLGSEMWRDTLQARTKPEEIALQFFRGEIGRLSALNELQSFYQSTQQFDEAIVAIRGAMRQMPHLADLPLTAGMILSNLGRFGEARPYFERSIEIGPTPDALRMRGSISLRFGENEKARQELEEALLYAPRNQQILFNLALANARLADYSRANDIISKLLAVNPEHRDGLLLRQQIQAASSQAGSSQ